MQKLLVAVVFAIVLVALPQRYALSDDASYVAALIRKGYLQQVQAEGTIATVTVGPKFDRLNAQSAKEEVCAAVLRRERLSHPQLEELRLYYANGQPLGRFNGARLLVN